MRKSKFTESQIVGILAEGESGLAVGGCLPQTRHQQRNLLPVEEQVRGGLCQ